MIKDLKAHKKAYNKVYKQKHKARLLIVNEKWRQKFPEKAAAQRRRYYETHKESLNRTQDAWDAANIEKVRSYKSAWRSKNKGKVNSWTAKRYASKLQRTPKWLTPVHYQQIEIFYDAAVSLTEEFGIKMSVDHIVPLQGNNVSGLHVPWNLQVISLIDNCIKNDFY